MSLIEKLIDKKVIEDTDVEEELYDICDRIHSSCNNNCPVYDKYGSIPWNIDLSNCLVFKSGKKMLYYLRTGHLF